MKYTWSKEIKLFLFLQLYFNSVILIDIILGKNYMKILIVEDNKILRENLCFLLKKHHYVAQEACDGQEALFKLSSERYDAIILDINMPIMSWKDFLREIRLNGKNIPVIALTSDGLLDDKLEMFDLGVDDYMTKPFEFEELLARLKSLLKRWEKQIDEQLILWNIRVNYSSKKVYIGESEIEFPFKQYLILELLSKNAGYPQSKNKIMEYVWWEAEENLDLASTTLESHIYSLRKKLGKNFIKTIKWVWYVIDKK